MAEELINQNQNVEVRHDDFDWDGDTQVQYSSETQKEMETLYEGTITSIEENSIIHGTVAGITESDVVLNIGFKSDGLVPRTEFRDMPDLKVGDEVEIFVEKTEDAKGQLILSRRKARLKRAWEDIVKASETEEVVKGKIISKTKGGLIVDVYGLETFLPGSQIDTKPISDYDQYVGKQMEFKVVKVNEAIMNAVVSHKALIESDLEEQRQNIISQLQPGQVLEGTIKNIVDYGAFIDLGGVDGLLHIVDISWGRIQHPSEVLEPNQKINVVVLKFEEDKKRISLGLKQLQSQPWEQLPENIKVGEKVKGKVVNIEDYGAFLEIQPGIEGLIHVSEVSWSNQPISAREFFKLGDEHEATIVSLEKEDKRMSLSIKQMAADPWEKVEEKYAINSKHTGIVKSITQFGVFVELDEYIGGMVHVSDLSWTKRINSPKEFCKVDEEMDVVILDIDRENRKLKLSHKHTEDDPWDAIENVYQLGTIHEGIVIRKEEKGSVVQLVEYGIESFAPTRHTQKEDGTSVQADERNEFKILEFDRRDKRIIVSHQQVWSDAKFEEEKTVKKERAKQSRATKDTLNKLNSSVEKSTLGDLDALAQLKNKLEGGE